MLTLPLTLPGPKNRPRGAGEEGGRRRVGIRCRPLPFALLKIVNFKAAKSSPCEVLTLCYQNGCTPIMCNG